VNLVTAAEVTRCALPALRRSRGHVVFVNFWDAHGVLPGWGPFAATKFGLRALAGAPRDARVVERAVTMASPSAAR
jgi:NAD(P)-dependent dehydrogenase (short-subunit alcohol dehydrogenase family)